MVEPLTRTKGTSGYHFICTLRAFVCGPIEFSNGCRTSLGTMRSGLTRIVSTNIERITVLTSSTKGMNKGGCGGFLASVAT